MKVSANLLKQYSKVPILKVKNTYEHYSIHDRRHISNSCISYLSTHLVSLKVNTLYMIQ